MKKLGLLVVGLLSLSFPLAVACGGGGEQPSATRTPTVMPTSSPTATTAPQPVATSASPPTPTSGPVETPPSNGDGDLVATGRELYLNVPPNAAPQALWCYQCHFIEGMPEAAGLIGPDHTHIGSDATNRVPGMSAEDYLRESIVDPELRIAEGVDRATPGLMTKAIVENLTDDQVDALVAFLLTLK